MDGILEKLQNIGLTASEAKVYFFLLQHKIAKATIISNKTNIPTSHIYNILEKLLSKGLISFKIVNNIKVYRPVDPQNLYSLIEEKEKKLENEKKQLKSFISKLKTFEVDESRENDFKYFEGINGVRSLFKDLIQNLKQTDSIYIASAPLAYKNWNAFFLEYFHKPRIKKKIYQQLIVPKSLRQHGKEREKLKFIDIKYYDLNPESEFGVMGDYVYFLSEGEKPYALLIKDANLAKTQKKIFDVLWAQAKK